MVGTTQLVKQSSLFRGWVRFTCPIFGCDHDDKFLETVHTKDDKASTTRRLQYLTLCHKAGRHQ